MRLRNVKRGGGLRRNRKEIELSLTVQSNLTQFSSSCGRRPT